MSTNSNSATGGSEKKEKYLDKVIPTLFIGVGGTGAEVLWRVRRRILSRVWTGGPQAVRLESLDQFPFAQFLHVDLDFNTVTETGRSSDDTLQSAIAFKPSERFVEKLDLSKYIGTDEKLSSFPLVKEWFPLSAQKVRDLNINPEKGAGQIRSIARLYFFDQYQKIKDAIKGALSNLRNNVDNTDKHKQLGLTLEPGALRVVVVASTAGGTGSGASIDMGYLSKVLLKASGATGATSTQLVLMLPTGYVGANAGRTQANTYAALMELETCMRGGATHIGRWSDSDVDFDVPMSPYDDVYFLDTENLAGSKTNAATACFEMAADVLFEDFSTADFANKKRSISVNQNQHKVIPYASRINVEKYRKLKLTFSRAYSAFGQAILDTQIEQKQSMVVERQVSRMLGVFFGVSAEADQAGNTEPTDADRDELLERLQLGFANEVISYDFASTHDKFRKGAECTTAPMVTELLRVGVRVRLEEIERGIDQAFNEVKVSGDHKEWPRKLTDLLKQIRRDAIKTVDVGTGMHEEGVGNRRAEMRRMLLDANDPNGVVRALWARVDNKEMGGLDFTIALVLRMKDRLENADTGLVKRFDEASRWFSDLSGFIDNTEIATLKDHLDQAVGKWVGGKSQTEAKWLQLAQAAKAFVRYHLLAVACREAAVLVGELSKDLGHKTGTDAAGNPVWTGFIGKLEGGRQSVRDLMAKSQQRIERTGEAMKQKHEMYQVLPAPDSGVDDLASLPAAKAREWAEQVFKDMGGTQELFSMLGDPQKCAELTGKLRNQALTHIAKKNTERGQGTEENPLFAALDALVPGERKERLAQVMQRAIPWAALNTGYLIESSAADQYKCFIGVKDSAKFAEKYGGNMTEAIPNSSKMTAKQVAFVEISEPGRLVCYVELSGVPTASLTALSDWYANYRSENEKIPVHTHKSLGKFVHARELSHTELAERKADLELMIQALALGDLQRSTGRGDDGALIFKNKGVKKAVRNEKSLRLNGFKAEDRLEISGKVEDSLAALLTLDQQALWWALIEYYETKVYPIRVVRGDDAGDDKEMHLPTLVCNQLLARALVPLEKSVGDKKALSQLQERATAQLLDWTEAIAGSEADPYRHEVNQGEGDENERTGGPQPKRVLKMEVFDPAWRLARPVVAHPSAQPASPAAGTPPMPPAVHPVMGVPGMPLPPPLHAWHLSVAGQNYGPFQMPALQGMLVSGQFNAATLVWREGMVTWVPAASLPELALLFSPLPSAAMPPPPQ
jgi:hypothetical protein